MTHDNVVGAAKRRARGILDAARTISNRMLIAAKDREDARTSCSELLPSVQERQQELLTFYAKYEELIELLCDCAQCGPNSALEANYQELRKWITENYPSVRKYVVAFLRYSTDDAEQGIALWGRSADAFEALVAAENLNQFLRADDGSMISRIHRTRDALSLYGEHLRQLAARA